MAGLSSLLGSIQIVYRANTTSKKYIFEAV